MEPGYYPYVPGNTGVTCETFDIPTASTLCLSTACF